LPGLLSIGEYDGVGTNLGFRALLSTQIKLDLAVIHLQGIDPANTFAMVLEDNCPLRHQLQRALALIKKAKKAAKVKAVKKPAAPKAAPKPKPAPAAEAGREEASGFEGPDALKQYLAEIRRIPLLSAEDREEGWPTRPAAGICRPARI